MNRKLLKNIAKWVWMSAILGFAVFYAINKKALITQSFSLLPIESLLEAAGLILVGKLCLVTIMFLATKHFNILLGWLDCYCIYNQTQLAKYIPGSIWQFVGRFSILNDRGIEKKTIRDSILAEQFWVVASAAFLAGILSFNSVRGFFEARIAEHNPENLIPWALSIFFLLASFAIIALLLRRRFFRWILRILPPLKAIPILILTWIFLGCSLWVTLEPFATSMPSITYIIGAYCFAYFMGFIVPFAPAGFGIREAVLTFVLTPFMETDVAILLAAVNRVIYFGVEIFVVIFCLRYKNNKPENEFTAEQGH